MHELVAHLDGVSEAPAQERTRPVPVEIGVECSGRQDAMYRRMAITADAHGTSDPIVRHRPRVLLIAEGCNPDMTSVPLEGWSHAKALSNIADTLVATHWRNEEALSRHGWVEGKDFICVDTEAAAKFMWKVATFLRGGSGTGWTTLAAMSLPLYYLFEHKLWQMMGARLRRGEFDIVHRLIPLSPTTPSLLAAKCREIGVPFVVGPLNGGVSWPKGFDKARRKEREWLSYVRSAYKFMPGYRSMRASASAILLGSRDTFEQEPRQNRGRCFYVPENAIDPRRFTVEPKRQPLGGRAIRTIFIGRLVPYKGADMLIEAAAPLVAAGSMTVEIVGDGPQRPELENQVARLGIAGGVSLAGWVDHRKVQEKLACADLFGFPSIREFGGAVALEAMACGVVPIVVNYGGPAELVTEKTGFRIPLGSRNEIIADLRALLAELVAQPQRIEAKSAPAKRRAFEQFTWDSKAAQVTEIYRWVLGQTPQRPQFVMPIPDLP